MFEQLPEDIASGSMQGYHFPGREFVARVRNLDAAVTESCLRRFLEHTHLGLEASRQPQVVVAERGHEFSSTLKDAHVARARRTQVTIEPQVTYPRQAGTHTRRTIIRSIVDNDDFHIVSSGQGTIDGLRQQRGAVESRYDDAYSRQIS